MSTLSGPRSLAATPISLELEPALAVLNSMALLNATQRMPALPAWVHETAAAMSAEERQANVVALDVLRGALVQAGDWADFPAYLADLATQSPKQLRDRALAQLERAVGGAPPDDALSSAEHFVAWAERALPAAPESQPALAAARDLLLDPPRMRQMLVDHLSLMWERHISAEWQRLSAHRERESSTLLHMLRTQKELVVDNMRAFVAGELAHWPGAPLEQVERICLVPSPHTGRYVTQLAGDGTLWLFFHTRRNFAVLGRQSRIGRRELQLRLEALADETRLQILELFAERDELSAQEIQDALSLTQSSASRHVRGLAMFLSEQRGEGASKRYWLSPAQIDMTFRALRQLVDGAEEEEDARQTAGDLRRFMDRHGRLTMYPTRSRDQLMVLEYIAARFEPGRSYTEKEVNQIIGSQLAHDDFVTVRRELFNFMFLGRETDGSRYWLIDPAERARRLSQ